MEEQLYDVAVIGAGPVGCVTALALKSMGLSIAVLESQPMKTTISDGRSLALSWNSYLILNRLHIWRQNMSAFPIESLHISDKGHFGKTVVNASDVNLSELGFVVPFKELLSNARESLLEKGVKTIYGQSATKIDKQQDSLDVFTSDGHELQKISSRLVVMADGGNSLAIAGLKHRKVIDHGCDAIVGILTTDQPPGRIAHQRFTCSGPIALLPRGKEYAFVWSIPSSETKQIMALDDQGFLASFQTAFGEKCGQFRRLKEKTNYKLATRIAEQPKDGGLIIIGNASQSLHPIAAQGLNLGLRDAWELGKVCHELGPDKLSSNTLLHKFRKRRRLDRLQTTVFSFGLNKFFSNKLIGKTNIRSLGLLGLDITPFAKKALIRRLIFGSRL